MEKDESSAPSNGDLKDSKAPDASSSLSASPTAQKHSPPINIVNPNNFQRGEASVQGDFEDVTPPSEEEMIERWSYSQRLTHKEFNLRSTPTLGQSPAASPAPTVTSSNALQAAQAPSTPTRLAPTFDEEVVRLSGRELKQWVPADHPSCFGCSSKFSLLNRQHHCRRCGRTFCGTCASKSVKIPENEAQKLPQIPKTRYYQAMEYLKTKMYEEKRVCNTCYADIAADREMNAALLVFPLAKILRVDDLLRLGQVCKSWWRATINLRKEFRVTQYALPTEPLKPIAKDSLWVNREMLCGHPSYLIKLLLQAKDDPVKLAEALEICRRPRSTNCRKLMCSRYCIEQFQLSHSLEILISGVDHPQVLDIAVKTLEQLTDEELVCVMPLLVQSLESSMRRRRTSGPYTSALLDFLERKAKASESVFIEYYWLIQVNFNVTAIDNKFVLRDFLTARLVQQLGSQRMRVVQRGERLVQCLEGVAKGTDEPEKVKVKLMEQLSSTNVFENITTPLLVPVNPLIKATAIDFDKISIKNSANKPMLLTFKLAEEHHGRLESKILYKREDMRKDQIVVNLIRLMDLTLRREGMDLGIVTYRVLPTSVDAGLIDIVLDSETVFKIEQSPHRSIQNWILHHNRDKTVHSVRMKYIRSLAAYCAMTYLLGIGDRHLENIMVTKDGALFHIDFGFVLGQDPKVMAPQIRVTPGMLDAIGGLGTEYYQEFDRTVKRAFNILRRRVSLFTSLLLLLSDVFKHSTDTAPPFTSEQMMEQINIRFMVGQGEEEAARAFDNFMQTSSNSWGALLIDVTHNNRDTPLSVVQAVKGLKKGWFG